MHEVGLTGLHASDFLGIAADHYERAGDPASACEYHARAAEHAQSRFANESALEHAERALALLASPGQQGSQALSRPDPTVKMR